MEIIFSQRSLTVVAGIKENLLKKRLTGAWFSKNLKKKYFKNIMWSLQQWQRDDQSLLSTLTALVSM